MQRDPGPLPQFARDLDLAAVQLCDALYDRQPQARASRTLGPRRVDAVEAVENPGQGFGWNAGAGIGDFDSYRGKTLDWEMLGRRVFWREIFAQKILVQQILVQQI